MTIFGNPDEGTLLQYYALKPRAVLTALMADAQLGYQMPVGGVAAYDGMVSVNGVGVDISCGNCAVQTNITLKELTAGTNLRDILAVPHRITTNPALNKLADKIWGEFAFGPGGINTSETAPKDHPIFDDRRWYLIPNEGGYRDELREKARRQLGTIGGGNHYIDVLVDEDEVIWVGVHFGSRGFGFDICKHFVAIAQGGTWGDKAKMSEDAFLLEGDASFDAYMNLMALCGDSTYAARNWVTSRVVDIMEGTIIDRVHNHHNYAWREKHVVDEELKELIVVRKGATPALPGQRSSVGGSMGDDAVILKGSEDVDYAIYRLQHEALFSTVHGAGRTMGRKQAAGKWKKGRCVRPGRISKSDMDQWIKARGLVLRGSNLEEAPQAYRRLPDVLEAQQGTVEVLHTLRPLIVCMSST